MGPVAPKLFFYGFSLLPTGTRGPDPWTRPADQGRGINSRTKPADQTRGPNPRTRPADQTRGASPEHGRVVWPEVAYGVRPGLSLDRVCFLVGSAILADSFILGSQTARLIAGASTHPEWRPHAYFGAICGLILNVVLSWCVRVTGGGAIA